MNQNRTAAHHLKESSSLFPLFRLCGAFLLLLIGVSFFRNTPGFIWFCLSAYLLSGYPVLFEAAEHIRSGNRFDENFLMSIASLGAFCIGEYTEAATVMIFFGIGELVQDMAMEKSMHAVQSLTKLWPETSHRKAENGWKDVPTAELREGDVIQVVAGERIPVDGNVIEGTANADVSAITGESVPVTASIGSVLLSGSICLDGKLVLSVTKPLAESYASQIAKMVTDAKEHTAPTEHFITRFSKIYTPIVVGLAAFLAVLPPLLMGDWKLWFHRALLFLVASCPCALVLSVPLGFFCGLGSASKQGILIKGANHLEALASIQTVLLDKTGTLTKGRLTVNSVHPEGIDPDDFWRLLLACEQYSEHPLARALRAYHSQEPEAVSDFHEIAGKGVSAVLDGELLCAGNALWMKEQGITPPTHHDTALFLAKGTTYLGCVTFSDPVKPDSKETISTLKHWGITPILLTGDTQTAAQAVAEKLGISEFHAALLPHEKLDFVKRAGSHTAFVGDGINDAPSLAAAEIGIAMGAGGREIATETADIILMNDRPEGILRAIRISRLTLRIVKENIGFALAVKVLVMVLGACGIASMPYAVFADVGVALIAIFNSLRIFFRK